MRLLIHPKYPKYGIDDKGFLWRFGKDGKAKPISPRKHPNSDNVVFWIQVDGETVKISHAEASLTRREADYLYREVRP